MCGREKINILVKHVLKMCETCIKNDHTILIWKSSHCLHRNCLSRLLEGIYDAGTVSQAWPLVCLNELWLWTLSWACRGGSLCFVMDAAIILCGWARLLSCGGGTICLELRERGGNISRSEGCSQPRRRSSANHLQSLVLLKWTHVSMLAC